jgi:hypothetical protein
MITEILNAIYQVSTILYEQVQLAKANQEQFKRLSERIHVVVQAVKRLETVKDSEQYIPALLALKKCLLDSHSRYV